MSAETLRRAAALMRERAEAATEGTWRVVPVNGNERADIRTEPELGFDYRGTAVATAADSEFGAAPMRDASHIASWHPAVALAVADWLDDTYPFMTCDNCTTSAQRCSYARTNEAIACCPECAHARHALTVARVYLGESDDAA